MSGSAWRRRGGGIPAVRGSEEDKGEVRKLLDRVGCQGGLAVDDQNLAALPGLCHADIGIVQGMPGSAWVRLSSHKAPKIKLLRHQVQREEGYNFYVEGFGQLETWSIQNIQNTSLARNEK